jgi:hypothetical protein
MFEPFTWQKALAAVVFVVATFVLLLWDWDDNDRR